MGTLTGKEAHYNILVLKSLLESEKIAMDISKYIKNHEGQPKKPSASTLNLKSINKTLVWEKGTLPRLAQRKYIEKREDDKWCLTGKGFLVALAFYDDIDMIYPTLKTYLNEAQPQLAKVFRKLGGLFSAPYAKDIELLASSKQFFSLISKQTRQLIDSGVDLDSMNETDLWQLITFKAYQPVINKLFHRHMKQIYGSKALSLINGDDTET